MSSVLRSAQMTMTMAPPLHSKVEFLQLVLIGLSPLARSPNEMLRPACSAETLYTPHCLHWRGERTLLFQLQVRLCESSDRRLRTKHRRSPGIHAVPRILKEARAYEALQDRRLRHLLHRLPPRHLWKDSPMEISIFYLFYGIFCRFLQESLAVASFVA